MDLIVGVKDSKQWHKENITRNSHHYSFLKYLPNSELWISKLQKDIPARIYFNTLVPVDDMVCIINRVMEYNIYFIGLSIRLLNMELLKNLI